MLDVLGGFATIWVVIGVGALLAQRGVLGLDAERILNRLSFAVGMPALMFITMARANVARVFSVNVLVALLSVVVCIGLYLASTATIWRRAVSHRVIGSFCSCYVNANNMGLPIAAYVMKDTSWVAPILLIQQGILQPIGLSILDIRYAAESGTPNSWLRNVTAPVRNPMTLGVMMGLLANLVRLPIPALAAQTLDMLGGLAVPCMLIAYGVSLRSGPRPQIRGDAETLYVCVLKLFVQPLVALGFAWLLGLDRATALAAVVLAGLPTAQNVFVFSSRYRTAERFSRDVILVTTVSSIVTIAGFASLVHLLW